MTLPAAPVLRKSVLYLVAFYNRPESASDVVSSKFVRPIVSDRRERVKFCYPYLNRYPEIRIETVDRFSNLNKYRPEVTGDVESNVAVD